MIARYLPVRPPRLDLDAAAAASRVHPDLLERFVELGLVDCELDSQGRSWFAPVVSHRVHLVMRLHSDLGLNYAAVALVLDLLVRIEGLENRQRVIRRNGKKPTWT